MPEIDEIPVNRIRNKMKEEPEHDIEEVPEKKTRKEKISDSDRDKKIANELKEEKETAEPKKVKETKKDSVPLTQRFSGLINFLKDERVHRITGLFLILASAYMLVAFTSFIFSWETDQD